MLVIRYAHSHSLRRCKQMCVCVCQSIFWTLSDAPKTEKQGPVVTLLCIDSCMVSWRRLVGNLPQTSRSMTVGFRKKGKPSRDGAFRETQRVVPVSRVFSSQ